MSVVQPFPERDPDTLVHTRIAVLSVQQEHERARNEDFKAETRREIHEVKESLKELGEKLDQCLSEIRRSRSVPAPAKPDGFHISRSTICAAALFVGGIAQHLITYFLGK